MAKRAQYMTATKAARLVGVSPKTLYRWEERGLIPFARRDWKGWRLYTSSDIRRIMKRMFRLHKKRKG